MYSNKYLTDYVATHELEDWQLIAAKLTDLVPEVVFSIAEVQAFCKAVADKDKDPAAFWEFMRG